MGFVQSASNSTTVSGTSLTVTLGAATGTGNTLVVLVYAADAITNPTVSGITLGGSADNWAAGVTAYNDTDINSAIWYDSGAASGQTSVVITFAAGTGAVLGLAAVVIEWAGLVTSSALDKTASANGVSNAPSSGATATLSQAAQVAFGCIAATSSGLTLTGPGSPWIELAQVAFGAGSAALQAGYQQVSATTALTYAGTATAVPAWGACIVTLKLAAAAPVVHPARVPQVRSRPPSRAITTGRAVAPRLPQPGQRLPPQPASPPPRRAITAGHAVPAIIPAAGVHPRAQLAPRRTLARAWIWFTPVRTVNATPPPPVNGTLPRGARLAPRRQLARAWIWFTPVTTTNAAPVPPAGTGGTSQGPDDYRRLIRRRELRILSMRL